MPHSWPAVSETVVRNRVSGEVQSVTMSHISDDQCRAETLHQLFIVRRVRSAKAHN